MKIKIEVSRPHYHPNRDKGYTKKRDLSVPPYWVANEREINPETGESFAVVMPPRESELFERRQPVHVHIPEYLTIVVKGRAMKAKIKVEKGQVFEPTVHFDNIESEELGIEEGDEATL
jgi:hypothetical protein